MVPQTLLLGIHANISKSNPVVFYPKDSSLISIFLHTHIEITIFMSIQFGYLKTIFHLPIPFVYRSVSRLEFQHCDCSQPTSSFSVFSQHHRPSYCYNQPKLFTATFLPSLLTPKGPPSMD